MYIVCSFKRTKSLIGSVNRINAFRQILLLYYYVFHRTTKHIIIIIIVLIVITLITIILIIYLIFQTHMMDVDMMFQNIEKLAEVADKLLMMLKGQHTLMSHEQMIG